MRERIPNYSDVTKVKTLWSEKEADLTGGIKSKNHQEGSIPCKLPYPINVGKLSVPDEGRVRHMVDLAMGLGPEQI